jgi:hypothetical protein
MGKRLNSSQVDPFIAADLSPEDGSEDQPLRQALGESHASFVDNGWESKNRVDDGKLAGIGRISPIVFKVGWPLE